MAADDDGWLEQFVGTWTGEGVGGTPGLEGGFPYGEELVVAGDGSGILTVTSRTFSLDDPGPLSSERAFWRPLGENLVEVVVASALGVAGVLVGERKQEPAGDFVQLASDALLHTATGLAVTAEQRYYAVRGDRLLYVVERAIAEHPMTPVMSAALTRA